MKNDENEYIIKRVPGFRAASCFRRELVSIVAEHCSCEVCPKCGCSHISCFDRLDLVDMYEIWLEVASCVNGENEMGWDEFLEFVQVFAIC